MKIKEDFKRDYESAKNKKLYELLEKHPTMVTRVIERIQEAVNNAQDHASIYCDTLGILHRDPTHYALCHYITEVLGLEVTLENRLEIVISGWT